MIHPIDIVSYQLENVIQIALSDLRMHAARSGVCLGGSPEDFWQRILEVREKRRGSFDELQVSVVVIAFHCAGSRTMSRAWV